MAKLLMHRRLFTKTSATILSTFSLLAIIWVLSYLLLPQGLVKINFISSLLAPSPYTLAAQIFAANVILGAFGILLMNQWHDKRGLAVGYYVHFLRSAVFHGVLRGTNSFAFPYSSQGKIIIGFFKVGLWETLALCLICSATAACAAYPTSSPKGLRSFFAFFIKPPKIEREGLMVLFLGVLILGFSSIMEALNIIGG